MTEENKEPAQEKQEQNSSEKTQEEKDRDNIIFIGTKQFMNYVTSVVMQFTANKQKEVIIKARGKYITKAVDVAEVSRKRFLEGEKILAKDTQIGSEEFHNKEGKKVNVSTIEITLSKE